jgi:hypothetical protein
MMTAGTSNANRRCAHLHHGAAAGESIDMPLSRRARLLGASALAGGALRSLAIAAGMVTVFGAAPAFAQCRSTDTGFTGTCAATAAIGANSTAVGSGANAAAADATAYGNNAVANGDKLPEILVKMKTALVCSFSKKRSSSAKRAVIAKLGQGPGMLT